MSIRLQMKTISNTFGTGIIWIKIKVMVLARIDYKYAIDNKIIYRIASLRRKIQTAFANGKNDSFIF